MHLLISITKEPSLIFDAPQLKSVRAKVKGTVLEVDNYSEGYLIDLTKEALKEAAEIEVFIWVEASDAPLGGVMGLLDGLWSSKAKITAELEGNHPMVERMLKPCLQ